jgi:protocatechuate 3,4-dioxygenase beta subunit
MHHDDHPVGRLLTRRELVALFGATAAATVAHRLEAQTSGRGPDIAVPNCVVVPHQTEGPYFVDERLLRSDVRSDKRTGVISPGAPLDLRLTISQVSAAGACSPLAGAQVDIWQCDALGRYSDVRDRSNDTSGQTFLRGHQLADAAGNVRFTTIYPGWYQGRAVHIHFKVRSPESVVQAYEFTSQFYFDERLTDRVHARSPYSTHTGQRVRNENDGIFRNGGAQLILPVEEARSGYTAHFTVGMRPGEDASRRGGWRRRGARSIQRAVRQSEGADMRGVRATVRGSGARPRSFEPSN